LELDEIIRRLELTSAIASKRGHSQLCERKRLRKELGLVTRDSRGTSVPVGKRPSGRKHCLIKRQTKVGMPIRRTKEGNRRYEVKRVDSKRAWHGTQSYFEDQGAEWQKNKENTNSTRYGRGKRVGGRPKVLEPFHIAFSSAGLPGTSQENAGSSSFAVNIKKGRARVSSGEFFFWGLSSDKKKKRKEKESGNPQGSCYGPFLGGNTRPEIWGKRN